MVKTTAMTMMEMPRLLEKSSIKCRATKTQKNATGATIRKTVRNSDLTSGPNMNLP